MSSNPLDKLRVMIATIEELRQEAVSPEVALVLLGWRRGLEDAFCIIAEANHLLHTAPSTK